MQIKSQSGSQIRPEVAAAVPAANVEKTGAAPAHVAQPSVAKSDAVQISDAGRALAAQGKPGGLTPERTAQIRQRVLDGAYNSLAVVDEVARRILGSGDLK